MDGFLLWDCNHPLHAESPKWVKQLQHKTFLWNKRTQVNLMLNLGLLSCHCVRQLSGKRSARKRLFTCCCYYHRFDGTNQDAWMLDCYVPWNLCDTIPQWSMLTSCPIGFHPCLERYRTAITNNKHMISNLWGTMFAVANVMFLDQAFVLEPEIVDNRPRTKIVTIQKSLVNKNAVVYSKLYDFLVRCRCCSGQREGATASRGETNILAFCYSKMFYRKAVAYKKWLLLAMKLYGGMLHENLFPCHCHQIHQT